MQCGFKVESFLVNKWGVYWMGAEIILGHDLGCDGHVEEHSHRPPLFPKFMR